MRTPPFAGHEGLDSTKTLGCVKVEHFVALFDSTLRGNDRGDILTLAIDESSRPRTFDNWASDWSDTLTVDFSGKGVDFHSFGTAFPTSCSSPWGTRTGLLIKMEVSIAFFYQASGYKWFNGKRLRQNWEFRKLWELGQDWNGKGFHLAFAFRVFLKSW